MMLSNKENIKFSILIPAYKAKYLRECIESILSQSYKNLEVIIVNDSSPENLTSIVEEFDDERICYFVNAKNCGAINVVDNWNITLSHATGDYAICMGDDDKLKDTCLESYKKQIELHPDSDVFHIKTQLIDETSKVTETLEDRPVHESSYDLLIGRWSGRRQFLGDFLYKVSTLKKNGGFVKIPMGLGSDDLTAVYQAKSKGIVNINDVGFFYRVSRITISSNGKYEVLTKALKDLESHVDKILSWEDNTIGENMRYKMQSLRLSYFEQLQYSILAHELASCPNSIIGIMKNKKKYGYPAKSVLKAFVSGCYNYIKNKL